MKDMSSMVKKLDSTLSFFHNVTDFNRSLQELRELSSQFYQFADYSETTFLLAQDKNIVMDNTKQYISRAIFAVADHLDSISANLQSSLLNTTLIPQTQHKIDILKLRIGACQQCSHKHAMSRHCSSFDSPRHHPRYILLPPLTDSATMKVVSRDSNGSSEGKNGRAVEFETEEPLFLLTYNCKPSLVLNSAINVLSLPVIPVRGDGISMLPKSEQSMFRFEGGQKAKQSMINWKQLQNKEIASLIKRGKKILA